jgi:F0F1-type ATP synthase delta subunit
MQERMKRFFLGKKFSQTSNTRHVVIDCKIDPSVGGGGKTWRESHGKSS